MSVPTFETLRERLTRNGSWRDLYIFEATDQTWQQLLDYARSLPGTVFTVDGEVADIPHDIEQTFRLCAEVGTDLEIDLGGLFIRWRLLLGGNQIEMDIDPHQVSATTFPLLVQFMSEVGARVQSGVFVTPEYWPSLAFFAFDHLTSETRLISDDVNCTTAQQSRRELALRTTSELIPAVVAAADSIGGSAGVESGMLEAIDLWRTEVFRPGHLWFYDHFEAFERLAMFELAHAVEVVLDWERWVTITEWSSLESVRDRIQGHAGHARRLLADPVGSRDWIRGMK